MSRPGSRSWRHDHWTWRHLSLLAVTDVDEAFRIVGTMTDAQRRALVETALIAQGLVLQDVPEARDWHERSAAAWGHALVLSLLNAHRLDEVEDGMGEQSW